MGTAGTREPAATGPSISGAGVMPAGDAIELGTMKSSRFIGSDDAALSLV